ncbi:MAG: tRNA uridine-5-carboxymethylaminomethyl(34) synthesis GTPase MnmE [Candidatus Caldatribacterium sp.]|nr:tRNA uridine-5-carboxymethylaminomethyl(34) synthesis GTPase MnmE [Candidatus Caldatribacterium sp.]
MRDDTIAALATPPGVGAIGIVRLSGRDAIRIASRLFRARSGKRVEEFQSFRMYLGEIVDPKTGEPFDEALCVVMRAPKSYTCEDVVEFHLHGGPLVLRKALEACLGEGARLARPGEFTERAFLNGRIDLTQAEAVATLVRARSEKVLELSLRHLKGAFGEKVREWERRLLLLGAYIEASCDFLDASVENEEEYVRKEIAALLVEIRTELDRSRRLQPLEEGMLVVIAGKPNVGKSSLLNLLVGKDRAIVTPFPGTTRDAIEEFVLLEGFPFRFVDTAGIRESENPVERIGVERARNYLERADWIVVVFDRSRPLEEEDVRLAELVRSRPHLVVLNKSDLPPALTREEVEELYPGEPILEISALTGEGREELLAALLKRAQETVGPEEDLVLLTVRQREELEGILRVLEEAWEAQESGVPLDVLGVLVEEALAGMQRLTGERMNEKLLETIFSHFCIGK